MKRIRRLIKWYNEWLRIYRGGTIRDVIKLSSEYSFSNLEYVELLARQKQKELRKKYLIDIVLCECNIYQSSQDLLDNLYSVTINYKRKKYENNKYTK